MRTVSAEKDLEGLLGSLIRQLDSIAGLETVWKRGVVHRGGPHYRLRGSAGPASIGEDECLLLAKVIRRFRPARCFIIGNGFGLSSAFIARVMEDNGGVSVVTLDNKSEGPGERCAKSAEALRVQSGCRILENNYGVSPQDVEKAAGNIAFDLVFIDGEHTHPQVTEDFRAARHLLDEQGIVCWHDYWIPGVPESVAEAERTGWHCQKVNSSCEMVFGTRDETVAGAIRSVLGNCEAPVPRRRLRARLKLMLAFIWSKSEFSG